MAKKKKEVDAIHPSHYGGEFQHVDAMKLSIPPIAFRGGLWYNCTKYLWRWQNKNGHEDLKKAEWYLSRLIREVEDAGPSSERSSTE